LNGEIIAVKSVNIIIIIIINHDEYTVHCYFTYSSQIAKTVSDALSLSYVRTCLLECSTRDTRTLPNLIVTSVFIRSCIFQVLHFSVLHVWFFIPDIIVPAFLVPHFRRPHMDHFISMKSGWRTEQTVTRGR